MNCSAVGNWHIHANEFLSSSQGVTLIIIIIIIRMEQLLVPCKQHLISGKNLSAVAVGPVTIFAIGLFVLSYVLDPY